MTFTKSDSISLYDTQNSDNVQSRRQFRVAVLSAKEELEIPFWRNFPDSFPETRIIISSYIIYNFIILHMYLG